MGKDRDQKKLRSVEESEEVEEVVRLGGKGRRSTGSEGVALPPMPEPLTKLEGPEKKGISERKSIEPDIDAIMDSGEAEWMSDETEDEKKPVPYGWFALILVLIVGLVATSAVLVLRSPEAEGEVARQVAIERIEADDEEDEEAEALVELVEENLRKYLAASSIEELLPVIRDPDRVSLLMEDWYSRNPITPREFDRLGVFQPLDLEGRLFWLITCEVKNSHSETILVEQTAEGRVLVDWETQVCYQPMAWDEFVVKRPEAQELDFRVYVVPDFGGMFSHEFDDEDRWSVYRISAKDSQEYLFGYVEKGSELDKQLIAQIRSNRGRPSALFMRLWIPEGTLSPRGVLVDRILSNRWALIDPIPLE